MTLNARPESRVVTVGVYAAALLGAFLIVGGLTWFLSYRTRPAPLNQARIEERLQNLRDINAAAAEGLNTFGWQVLPRAGCDLQSRRDGSWSFESGKIPRRTLELACRVEKVIHLLHRRPRRRVFSSRR